MGEAQPKIIKCDSCEILVINGVICHEHGCPDAWKDEKHECNWCGREFVPEFSKQDCCDHACMESYHM